MRMDNPAASRRPDPITNVPSVFSQVVRQGVAQIRNPHDVYPVCHEPEGFVRHESLGNLRSLGTLYQLVEEGREVIRRKPQWKWNEGLSAQAKFLHQGKVRVLEP